MTNVLLTGAPRSGKSTLLATFIEGKNPKTGFLTKEIREDGERVGFELVSSSGERATLAHVSIESEFQVSRYGVDIETLESFLDTLTEYAPDDFLYIDEAGQMELASERFRDLFREYLDAENDFLGTVTAVFDDPFVQEIKERPDVKVIEVAPETRDQALQELNQSYK